MTDCIGLHRCRIHAESELQPAPLGVPRYAVYQCCDYKTHNKPGGCHITPVSDNLPVNIEPDRQ